ncbi:hypothetical protein CEXT_327971, partial [Caerostris extrusa]
VHLQVGKKKSLKERKFRFTSSPTLIVQGQNIFHFLLCYFGDKKKCQLLANGDILNARGRNGLMSEWNTKWQTSELNVAAVIACCL